MAFFTLPAFRHLVQTLILVTLPSFIVLTTFKLGKNRLRLMPVMRCPTPPFFLARPLRFIVRPAAGPLPHISQIRDMTLLFAGITGRGTLSFAVADT